MESLLILNYNTNAKIIKPIEIKNFKYVFISVFEMNPHLWVGLPGLATDIQTVKQKLEFRK